MAKKKKKIIKILIISTVAIVAVLIFVLALLNYFLKKNIEDTFNQALNANVSIEKVRVNYFNASIDIYGLSICGKQEFKKDTLFYVAKASLGLESFDQTEESISLYLNKFILETPIIRNIISETGVNCWESIAKKKSLQEMDADSSAILSEFEIFIEDFQIIDAQVINIDRVNNTEEFYSNINLNVNSSKTDSIINSEFSLSLDFANTMLNEENDIKTLLIAGSSKISGSKYIVTADCDLSGLLFSLDADIDTDTISTAESSLSISANLNDFNRFTEFETQGSILLHVNSRGIFNKNEDFSITALLTADSVLLTNNNNDNLFADINANITYTPKDSIKLMVKSDKLFIANNEDTISGSFDYILSNTLFSAFSDIESSANPIVFSSPSAEFSLLLNSDLEGILNDNTCAGLSRGKQGLEGNFFFSTKYKSTNQDKIQINEFAISLSKQDFSILLDLVTDRISGIASLVFENPGDYYTKSLININSDINIKKIAPPHFASNNPTSLIGLEDNAPSQISFPSKINLQVNLQIDSIMADNEYFTRINSIFIYTPEKIGISDFYMEYSTAKVAGSFGILNMQDYTIFENEFHIENFDLSTFSSVERDITGIINIESNNFIISDTSHSNAQARNTGLNIIELSNFKIETELLKDYSINEDYIVIDKLKLEIQVQEDSLVLLPTNLKVNDVDIAGKACLNIFTDDLSADIILNIPDMYLNNKIKLLISMFSEASKSNNKPRTSDNAYKLKIKGPVSNLNYKIYEY